VTRRTMDRGAGRVGCRTLGRSMHDSIAAVLTTLLGGLTVVAGLVVWQWLGQD
jgi:hypothetical protein